MIDLIAPKILDDLTFDQIIQILIDHFDPIPNIIYERFILHKIKQDMNENIKDFVVRLKRQAAKCCYGAQLNEQLRDLFVVGLNNDQLIRRLLSEKDLKFESAIDIAQMFESTAKETLNIKNKAVDKIKTFKNPNIEKAKFNKCRHCGKSNHISEKCFFREGTCKLCHEKGHISTVCRYKKPTERNKNTEMHFKQNPPKLKELTINAVSQSPKITTDVLVENQNIKFEVDSGAEITVIPFNLYSKFFQKCSLEKYDITINGFGGQNIEIKGKCNVRVLKDQISKTLELVLTKHNHGIPRLGRNWMQELNMLMRRL
ncbi:hypothetical protein HET73_05905 [Wolbachia endosymbiont of Atemnus politus]|uniref:hypothetical protein n=1 Tax=Wolbachia endosymbiont of Atemnus politus TaxID=2682840 RepID=UPI001573D691|nr:hypothetical protein [Wolbachia endosymbiont of Atemnus politus]NSM56887.1 hypothetical protein [Wolbachia endosymbiont of Atemnus politus]